MKHVIAINRIREYITNEHKVEQIGELMERAIHRIAENDKMSDSVADTIKDALEVAENMEEALLFATVVGMELGATHGQEENAGDIDALHKDATAFKVLADGLPDNLVMLLMYTRQEEFGKIKVALRKVIEIKDIYNELLIRGGLSLGLKREDMEKATDMVTKKRQELGRSLTEEEKEKIAEEVRKLLQGEE